MPKGGNALVVFSAEWCGPCKMYRPTYTRFQRNNPHVQLFHVDADTAREITSHYGIRSVPTSIFVVNGVEKKPIPGVLSYNQLNDVFGSEFAG